MNRIPLFMLVFILICFIFPVLILPQPQHFTFTVNTGDSYSIVVTQATLDSVPLQVGDEIGVFTPTDLCVGASAWNDTTPLSLTAWIDNSQTPGVDGYKTGEVISFRVWDQSSDTEFPATAIYAQGNGTFGDGAFANLSLAAVSGSRPSDIIVTNTNDSGSGSLREAIQKANSNAGHDTITFAIPESDPGFNDVAGTWTIALTNPLPALTDDSLFVDGDSQALFIGQDTNPDGPEIVINGSQITNSNFGFFITSAGNRIHHLVLNGFDTGVYITGDGAQMNSVTGCFIGTDATGSQEAPNNSGIAIYSSNNTIGGTETGESNVISGNKVFGVLLSGKEANNNSIIGNFIGTDASGTNDLGNEGHGIMLQIMPSGNEIIGNLISGNNQDGIRLTALATRIMSNLIGTDITGTTALGNGRDGIGMWGAKNCIIGDQKHGQANIIAANEGIGISLSNADSNEVLGNMLGTGKTGDEEIGNVFSGISLNSGSSDNKIGPGNIIQFNGTGIFVNLDSTLHNTISQNSISSNSGMGISNANGGNEELPPPINLRISATKVTGQAPSDATVEIFSDNADEGKLYEGTTTADSSGNFSWNGSLFGPYITATATDSEGNTSEFSQPFNITDVEEQTESGVPEKFSLSQNYPNPFNPQTQIRFSLPETGEVKLQIFNLTGQKIATLLDRELSAGEHMVIWNGCNESGSNAASGIYLYWLQSGSLIKTKKMVLLR